MPQRRVCLVSIPPIQAPHDPSQACRGHAVNIQEMAGKSARHHGLSTVGADPAPREVNLHVVVQCAPASEYGITIIALIASLSVNYVHMLRQILPGCERALTLSAGMGNTFVSLSVHKEGGSASELLPTNFAWIQHPQVEAVGMGFQAPAAGVCSVTIIAGEKCCIVVGLNVVEHPLQSLGLSVAVSTGIHRLGLLQVTV